MERAGQVTSTRVRIPKDFSLSVFLGKHPLPPSWREMTVHTDPSALRAYGVTSSAPATPQMETPAASASTPNSSAPAPGEGPDST